MTTERRSWRLVRSARSGSSSTRRFVARTRRWRLRALLPYLVLLAVLAVAGGIGWVVFGTTVFVADRVEVAGATSVSAEEIIEVAAVPWDVPLAQLDTDAIAERVRGLKPIAEARVARSWPGSVTITVRERTAVAVFVHDGEVALVDAEGVAFRTVDKPPKGLPEVSVANRSADDPAAQAALAVARDLPATLRAKLVRITAETAEQVTLEIGGGRTVFWGGAEDNARKAVVTALLLERPGKRMDVSAPDEVTVR